MLTRISTKNCIEPYAFHENIFSFKKSPRGDQGKIFLSEKAGGDHRSVFEGKNFSMKSVWLYAVFCADSR